eukprot:5729594-Prorocentrum_lima.AAC.1
MGRRGCGVAKKRDRVDQGEGGRKSCTRPSLLTRDADWGRSRVLARGGSGWSQGHPAGLSDER